MLDAITLEVASPVIQSPYSESLADGPSQVRLWSPHRFDSTNAAKTDPDIVGRTPVVIAIRRFWERYTD